MTSGAPWSVKGIDPKTREIAKDLARRSGMTLGEWLTHVIAEDGPEDGPALPSARKAADRPPSENRTPRRGDDLERVLEALHDLSSRFEASVQEQSEAAARFDHAIAELKADQARVAERLQAAESGGGGAGKVETLRALEGTLNKVAGHLATGEGRQREALVAMRRELGEEMSRVADQVNRRVREIENSGADAIAQVSAEVTRVGTAVEQRLHRADEVQAAALEKLGGEIARITERLSERISASERRAAVAVEEVGAQVARMADRIHARQERSESELGDRLRQSEERTIKLLEEARQTLDRRLLRAGAPAADEPAAATAFSERWQPVDASDVEAAQAEAAAEPEVHEAFLDVAATDDSSVVEDLPPQGLASQDPAIEDLALEVWTADAEAIEEGEVDADAILEAVYNGRTDQADESLQAELPYADLDEDDEPKSVGYEAYAPTLTADADFAVDDDLAALQAVAEAITGEDAEVDSEDEDQDEAYAAFRSLDAHGEPEESFRPSTRELITEARAAAFAEPSTFRPTEPEADEDASATFIDFSARKPRQAHSMRGVLMAGGAAAFMGLAGAGYVALHPEMIHGLGASPAKPIPVGPPSTQAQASAPQAAVALATAPVAAKAEAQQDLGALYRDAVAKVDAGDASGVAPLTTAANLGYAPAQQRLGKLYEDGGAGLAKDAQEGRRWTQRAAANGDARGMHNLGLDYYQGVGGIKNEVVAAEWFRRAAELGLRDSQFNLALFYEKGVGVARDLPAAYRWYLIAGRSGDTEVVTRAGALKDQLTAADRAKAEALATAFRPDPAAPPASMTASLRGSNPKQLALAQRALNKLGYFKGGDDGQPSEALGQAIQTYQRERGLADNGQLSPELVQTFAHIVQ